MTFNKSVTAACLVLLAALAVGCEEQGRPSPSPTDSPKPTSSPVPGACYVQKHIQPDDEHKHKVDLLFMIDTSGSMTEDRIRVAESINDFVRGMPEDADFRIGVMMAHGCTSEITGKLWRYKSNKYVLDSSMPLDDVAPAASRESDQRSI